MSRLTERDEYGNANIIGVDSQDLQMNLEYDQFEDVTSALNRLADFEDMCFDNSGKQVLQAYRLRELAEAERETYRNATQVTGYCPICAERAKQEQQEPEPLTATMNQYIGKHVWVKQADGIVWPGLLSYDFTTDTPTVIDSCGKYWWINEITKLEVYATEPKGGLDGK